MAIKKIGVLTFHVAHNYGAMLQAYALPVAVNKLGYDCEVIDYRFPYIYQWGKSENLKELIYTHGIVGGGLRCLKRLIKGRYSPKRKYNKFNFFREKIMLHSEKIYREKRELCNLDYDAILFGSDQIWNEDLLNGVAEEFFGDFPCLPHTRKIAYAASNGKGEFPQEYKKQYYEYLKAFAAISVREETLAAALKRDGIATEYVLDPTLLLTQEDWNRTTEKMKSAISLPSDKYLLLYVFDEEDIVYELAQRFADAYDLAIVIILYQKKEVPLKDAIIYTECGPGDFLRLFAGASYVVTTSFHGTAFSIIYHKNFICVPHPTLHERTDSLLSVLGLEDRSITAKAEIDNMVEINWESVNGLLEKERKKSIDFIINAIEGKEESYA